VIDPSDDAAAVAWVQLRNEDNTPMTFSSDLYEGGSGVKFEDMDVIPQTHHIVSRAVRMVQAGMFELDKLQYH
jgi:hypothetical protein